MTREQSEASISLRPLLFILDSCIARNKSTTISEDSGISGRTFIPKLRIFKQFSVGKARFKHLPSKEPWAPLHCSSKIRSTSRNHDHAPREPEQSRPDVRLYQAWRSPSWLHHSKVERTRNDYQETHAVACFASIVDGTLRLAFTALVLVGLGRLHYLYEKANEVVQNQVENVSAYHQADIAVGRVVRCNPVSGIRVKNVIVSKSACNRLVPFGQASYVQASFSGYIALFSRKRPLELRISVNRGAFTVSCSGPAEYDKGSMGSPSLEEQLRLLTAEWKKVPVGTEVTSPRLVELGSIAVSNSRIHIKRIRQGVTGDSDHSVHVVSMSARFDGTKRARESSAFLKGEPHADIIILKARFLDGGNAHIRLTVWRSHNEASNGNTFSLLANTKCSNVHMGTVASFLCLPFRIKDGLCSGSADIKFSPSASSIPTIYGQAEMKSLVMRFDPNPESPELRNVTGKLRFRRSSVILDRVEGYLGSIPLQAKGHIDLEEGFDIESHTNPFDVNRIIETFAIDRFIPVEGSVIGKAMVRGHLNEPCVSGWVKSVGNRVVADRVPLKSTLMTYNWDASAGNLLFPKIQATIVGGGEIRGNGGIYFDMTRVTPSGYLNERHHERNPKAIYWNPEMSTRQTLPALPVDDFEIDKWAPYRPYDSMDFMISCSHVRGENLVHWYGPSPSNIAMDPMSHIGGVCRITGHAEDANSRLVWRSTRTSSAGKFNCKHVPASAPQEHDIMLKQDHIDLQKFLYAFEGPPEGSAVHSTNNDMPFQNARSGRQEDSEFLGGLILMKLGDLPEARRIKARTTIKGLHVKPFFSHNSSLKDFLSRAPNVVVSMDTFFKGTICMQPSWDGGPAKASRKKNHLDIVSVDGGLAVRKLSLNGVIFESIVSGSFSLSATDISMNLTESHFRSASRLFASEYDHEISRSDDAFDVLQVELNAKGIFNVHLKWSSSEIHASMHLNEQKRRIAQLCAWNVNLQQLAGECNPFFEDESVQGILTTSSELDLTNQVGSMQLTVTDLSVGPVYFELVKVQFSLKDGEIFLDGEIWENGFLTLKLDGSLVILEEFSDFKWCLNINFDHAQVHGLSLVLQNAMTILAPQSGGFFSLKETKADNAKTQKARSGIHCTTGNSSVTYWEIPDGLSFTDQTKWFNESSKNVKGDVLALFGLDPIGADMVPSTHDSCNSVSGRVTVHYSSQNKRDKRKFSVERSERGPLAALGDVTLSFDLTGENWSTGMTKMEQITIRGFLEDGGLTLEPSEVRGEDGLLMECQGTITGPGSIDGSLSIHHAPVSSATSFQKAGLLVEGNVEGMFRIKGNVTNPNLNGHILLSNATCDGRFVSHPQANLSCSNGRCIMNIDAAIGKVQKGRRASGSQENLLSADAVRHAGRDDEALRRDQKAATQDKPAKGIDTVTARFSIPVRLLIHDYVLPKLSKIILRTELDALEDQPSFDEDWIFGSVEIRRYGMALLSAFMPELGWIEGNSDVIFRLAGTQRSPQVAAFVKVKDGSVRPLWMKYPINFLHGEIEVRKFGLLFCKHLSGRCNGRGVSLRGGMFISKQHRDRMEMKLSELQKIVSPRESYRKMQNREPPTSLNEALTAIRKNSDGIQIDIGGIPTQFPHVCEGTISGKVMVTGTIMSPKVDGSVLFSEGVINASSAFSDSAQSARASSELFAPHMPSLGQSLMMSRKATGSGAAGMKNDKTPGDEVEGPSKVQFGQLTLDLGHNVRIIHSFLFNVLVRGNISLSGKTTSPTFFGKINILSGSVSAHPARWAVRKSESSYISFAHNPIHRGQDPMIKLVLENDTTILRVAECTASTWMDNLSFSDKTGNRVPEQRRADAFRFNADERRSTQKFANIMTVVMMNALSVGGEIGKYDWKLFPTHFGYASEKLSRQPLDKYGAGFRLDQDSYCFESNVFVDKLKGGQIMVKLARVMQLHLFRDQSRQLANLELQLPEY